MPARFPSGRLVAAVLVVSFVLWAVMVFGTLAHLAGIAEGADPFDLRPLGYGVGEARAFLKLLGDAGRAYYAHVQLTLDTIYPATYAVSRGLLLWWLTSPGRLGGRQWPLLWRVAVLVPPVLTAGFDYLENARIAAMLAIGPQVAAELVAAASLATQIKSVMGLMTELTATVLAAIAVVRWLRRRTPAR